MYPGGASQQQMQLRTMIGETLEALVQGDLNLNCQKTLPPSQIDKHPHPNFKQQNGLSACLSEAVAGAF